MKLVFLSLFMAFLVGACDQKTQQASAREPSQLVIVSENGEAHNFKVELALTPAQQAKGLMYRTEMAPEAGMLFYFNGEAVRSFWMKNTLIPLDMIFIKADGRILNIHDSAKPNDLTSISSDGPVAAVLELNGGISRKIGLKAGDRVNHILFGN